MVLTIKTDNPTAEVGLYFNTGQQRQYKKWQAHRQLAESIHREIDSLLKAESKTWKDLSGVICYKGPGSFTGLRIGLTVGNALAYSLVVPIVGTTGNDWINMGVGQIAKDINKKIVIPVYGNQPHITLPRK